MLAWQLLPSELVYQIESLSTGVITMTTAREGPPTESLLDLAPTHTAVILDAVADGVFTVGMDWRITSFNRAAEQITGVPRERALGQRCADVFRANVCETGCPIRQAMRTGRPVINRPVYVVDGQGNRAPISVSCGLLKNPKGDIIGGVETFRDLALAAELGRKMDRENSCQGIISRNHRMRQLFEILPTLAASDSTVLVEGESGTGKELVAEAIHNLSPRRDKPFVAVNCSALPDALLESELFGYKAGAFTDAKKDKPGRFARAEHGTLFLDEIGDISPALQVRLLRVLQDKVYEPLGSTQSMKADVRIIVATNKILGELVDEGDFRTDLYYRINVIKLSLPLLRDRKEDIPLLVDHFVHRFNLLQGKDVAGVSEQSLELLMAHSYPGNIRELENIIEHAFVLCSGGLIEPKHLPDTIAGLAAAGEAVPLVGATIKEMERVLIIDALKRHDWNRKAAAKQLGLCKSTFFRKVKEHGIALHERDGRFSRDSAASEAT